MGIYDRDYMRRDDRPPPSAGGRLGFIAFLAVLLAVAIYLHRAHPWFVRNLVVRPWTQLAHRFQPRVHRPAKRRFSS